MKNRITAFGLLLLLIFSFSAVVPASSAAPLSFDLKGSAEAVDAVFQVLNSDVQEVQVQFDPSIGYAQANFKNGRLYISAVSTDSIDLQKPFGTAAAVNSNGEEVFLRTELVMLVCDGVKRMDLTAAADAEPVSFGTTETVYTIKAEYVVETEDVEDLSVTFPPELKGSTYEYQDGVLTLNITSDDPIDLMQPAAYISAQLASGDTITPKLQMKNVEYNDEPGGENLHADAKVFAAGEECVVHVDMENIPSEKTYYVWVVAYDAAGRMISSVKDEVIFTEGQTAEDYSIELTDDMDYVNVMIWNDEGLALIKEMTLNV